MDVTRVVPRAGFVVAVSMVLALATASAASAQSTVGKNAGGNGIVYTDPASNVDRIELSWLNNTSTDTFEHAITSVAGGTAPVSAGTGCGGGPPSFFCGSTMASLVATLGGGDDALDLRPASTAGHALPTTVTGGSGDDTVQGGSAADDVGGGIRRRPARRPHERRRVPRPGRDGHARRDRIGLRVHDHARRRPERRPGHRWVGEHRHRRRGAPRRRGARRLHGRRGRRDARRGRRRRHPRGRRGCRPAARRAGRRHDPRPGRVRRCHRLRRRHRRRVRGLERRGRPRLRDRSPVRRATTTATAPRPASTATTPTRT